MCDGDVPLLFTENETNNAAAVRHAERLALREGRHQQLSSSTATRRPSTRRAAGTKVAAHYRLTIGRGRDADAPPAPDAPRAGRSTPFADFDAVFAARLAEADAFYAALTPPAVAKDADRANVHAPGAGRHAVDQAVLLLRPGPVARRTRRRAHLPPQQRKRVRNADWFHMYNDDIISMPDKWEYPWYAAWDLAFHMIPLAHGRSRLRQAAARPDAAQRLPAPERPDAGLRVELRRRQSAGACLGHLPAVPAGQGAARRQGRHRVPEVRLLQAAGQLHLVGQPQGPHRQQRLRRRLPRPGQHRRVRPLARRCPPAATSTRPTAPPGWCSSASRCCASRSSWRCTIRCTRSSSRSSSSTPCSSPARWTASASATTRCGTRRTASSTTCCACPTAARRG